MIAIPYAEDSLRLLREESDRSFRALLRHADASHLAVAISELGAQDQVLLALTYFENLTASDVAAALGLSLDEVLKAQAFATFALVDRLNGIADRRLES